MKVENWTIDDLERFTVLTMLYKMSDKIETHHYANSTVMHFDVLGEITTLTVSDELLGTVKAKLEDK